MFSPGDMAVPHDDYRRTLESHPFCTAVVGQLKPQSGVVRFDQLDASPYLIGMPGGMIADLRTGQLRKLERGRFPNQAIAPGGDQHTDTRLRLLSAVD